MGRPRRVHAHTGRGSSRGGCGERAVRHLHRLLCIRIVAAKGLLERFAPQRVRAHRRRARTPGAPVPHAQGPPRRGVDQEPACRLALRTSAPGGGLRRDGLDVRASPGGCKLMRTGHPRRHRRHRRGRRRADLRLHTSDAVQRLARFRGCRTPLRGDRCAADLPP